MSGNRHRLRELEGLRALVTTGTTVGAAQRLGISQSAVSRSLSQLEERLGDRWMDRCPSSLLFALQDPILNFYQDRYHIETINQIPI